MAFLLDFLLWQEEVNLEAKNLSHISEEWLSLNGRSLAFSGFLILSCPYRREQGPASSPILLRRRSVITLNPVIVTIALTQDLRTIIEVFDRLTTAQSVQCRFRGPRTKKHGVFPVAPLRELAIITCSTKLGRLDYR